MSLSCSVSKPKSLNPLPLGAVPGRRVGLSFLLVMALLVCSVVGHWRQVWHDVLDVVGQQRGGA